MIIRNMRIKEIKEDSVVFDNGTVVSGLHEQDCCESVWASFKNLVGQPGVDYHDFPDAIESVVEVVPEFGFRLDKYFIPCYNSQNGYYSSDLSLVITKPDNVKTTIDVSKGVQDFID